MKQHSFSWRKFAECIGLLALLLSVWAGRHVLVDSLHVIANAQSAWIILACCIVWTNFLWSGIGYKLLAPNIRLWHVILTHLAASGPGRIIPAGGGHFGFGVLFLTKQKYSLERAIAVATLNNVFGFIVNMCAFIPVLVFYRTSLPNIHIDGRLQSVALGSAVVVLLFLALYKRNKNVHKRTDKTKKEVKKLTKLLVRSPHRLAGLTATMSMQIVTHVSILICCSYALSSAISPLQAFIAMSSGVAVGSIVPTPGGVGGVEAGIIASLTTLGLQSSDATAIALSYRAITYMLPLAPGVASYVYMRKKSLL